MAGLIFSRMYEYFLQSLICNNLYGHVHESHDLLYRFCWNFKSTF